MHLSRPNAALAGAACAALLACALPDTAQANPLFGAEVAEEITLTASVGFPDVQVGVLIPLMDNLDIQPRLQLVYGRNLAAGCCNLVAASDVRYQFLDTAKLRGAVTGSLGVVLPLRGQLPTGLELLWPGVQFGLPLEDILTLEFGLQLQDTLFVGNNASLFNLMIAPNIGLSVPLTGDLDLGLRIEGGPDMYFAGGTTTVAGQLRAMIGMSYVF